MLFNSFEYIFFLLPVVFGMYFFLCNRRLTLAAKTWLAAASLFFYSWWDVRYLGLILFSIMLNYTVGGALRRTSSKGRNKTILIFGIIVNLALLGYYKYADFFITTVNLAAGTRVPLLHVVLPLGISFFTFTQIAYIVDVYKGYREKAYDFINYTLFVTFFPHLLAGPIIHHKEMMPQFDRLRNKVIDYRNIYHGLLLISLGLFKKVIIADSMLGVVSRGFDNLLPLTLTEAWMTSLAYTFQIYFDFSGYTDIALGSALLFNIKLPENFNSPYKALNIQDFWRRWHMTLSRFLRDYIYIPLGGNKKSEGLTLGNLFITFLIGGLWHGAGWTFVLWGAMHGMAAIIHRLWQGTGRKLSPVLAWLITFNFINAAWVFFRAPDWEHASNVFKGMLGFNGLGNAELLETQSPIYIKYEHFLLLLILCFPLVLKMKNSSQINPVPGKWQRRMIIGASIVAVLNFERITEFIYFNF